MVKETIIIANVQDALDALKKEVEEKVGRTVELPSDFDMQGGIEINKL